MAGGSNVGGDRFPHLLHGEIEEVVGWRKILMCMMMGLAEVTVTIRMLGVVYTMIVGARDVMRSEVVEEDVVDGRCACTPSAGLPRLSGCIDERRVQSWDPG